MISPDPNPPRNETATEPRFDFYTMLSKQKLDLSPEIETSNLERDPETAQGYILQAGSFRQEADADRRRGEIALLGFSAKIKISGNATGKRYRVYLGPFPNDSKLSRARALTAQAGIDTLLLRREGL